jgi:hypothetical protein
MSWTRKKLVLVVAIMACACGASYLSLGSEPVSAARPGAEWQCSRMAWILTICTRIRHAEPMLQSSRKNPMCRWKRDEATRV